MSRTFMANYKKHGKWYVGWIEEISGVNTQGKTLQEVKENLKEALFLILQINRIMARKEMRGKIIREPVTVVLDEKD